MADTFTDTFDSGWTEFILSSVAFVVLATLIGFIMYSFLFVPPTTTGVGIPEVTSDTPDSGNIVTYESLTEAQQETFRESVVYQNNRGYSETVVFETFDEQSHPDYISLDGTYYELETTTQQEIRSISGLALFLFSAILSLPTILLGWTAVGIFAGNISHFIPESLLAHTNTIIVVVAVVCMIGGIITSLYFGLSGGMAGAITVTQIPQEQVDTTPTPITELSTDEQQTLRYAFEYQTLHIDKATGTSLDGTVIQTDGEYYKITYGLFADGFGATPDVIMHALWGLIFPLLVFVPGLAKATAEMDIESNSQAT